MSSLLLLFLLLSYSLSTSAAPTDFIFAVCSPSKTPPNSPYQLTLFSLLSSLVSASAASSYYSNLTSPSVSVSALFQCRGDLPPSDCSSCVSASVSSLNSLCPFSVSATVQLSGCVLRFENSSAFIGAPDNGVMYKKCGAPEGYSDGPAGFLSMRDAALAGVVEGTGGYRVGGAGYVEAMAQCDGDLSAKDCNDCVAAATTEVKSSCGFAVGGDVYLGKCYVKFWSAGVYPGNHQEEEDDGDETGKTVAIIIGVIAGIALLVIFLSSLSRHGSGKS